MKVGETVEVTIGGHKVADAKIVDVNHKDSTVELVIPGRRVVMGFKTQLDVAPVVEQTTTHAILGVEQQTPTSSNEEAVGNHVHMEAPEPVVEAPVETPVVEAPSVEEKPVDE